MKNLSPVWTKRVAYSLLMLANLSHAYAAVSNVAWYRFGEDDSGAGPGLNVMSVTLDRVGTNHLRRQGNLRYTGATSAAARKQVASSLAIQFDGSGRFLSNAVVTTGIQNFGIELWVRPSGGGDSVIAYNGDPNFNGWGISEKRPLQLLAAQSVA